MLNPASVLYHLSSHILFAVFLYPFESQRRIFSTFDQNFYFKIRRDHQNNSYERHAYESVDVRSLFWVISKPSIDKARDSSFSLISLAADSLLYNAVSTIRYLFFVILHVNLESIATACNAFYMQSDKKRDIVLWILHCKATSRPQVK